MEKRHEPDQSKVPPSPPEPPPGELEPRERWWEQWENWNRLIVVFGFFGLWWYARSARDQVIETRNLVNLTRATVAAHLEPKGLQYFPLGNKETPSIVISFVNTGGVAFHGWKRPPRACAGFTKVQKAPPSPCPYEGQWTSGNNEDPIPPLVEKGDLINVSFVVPEENLNPIDADDSDTDRVRFGGTLFVGVLIDLYYDDGVGGYREDHFRFVTEPEKRGVPKPGHVKLIPLTAN